MGEWTFLTNHAVVLVYLARHPQITARELAFSIGITERAVRKIIADLEAEGYISKAREGRGVRYSINSHLPLRHRTQKDKSVEGLLFTLGWEGDKKRKKRTDRVKR
jgi:predicted DNA-binding transcriptional regulator YafY